MDGSDFVVGEAHAPQPLLLQRDGGFVFALGVVLRKLHFSEFGLVESWGRRPNQHCAGNDTSLLAVSNSTTGYILYFYGCVLIFLFFFKKLYYLFLKKFN